VRELKRLSANPHRDLYLTKYYRKSISDGKDLNKNVESLDKTILQKYSLHFMASNGLFKVLYFIF